LIYVGTILIKLVLKNYSWILYDLDYTLNLLQHLFEYSPKMKEIINKIQYFQDKSIESFEKQKWIERDYYKVFDNTSFPIFGITWLRWVGKTTYLLSRRIKNKNSIYISCDWNFLAWLNLLDIILYFRDNFDIETFYLDEIQFLDNWDNILKNIYDLWWIKIIFSGSSKIKIEQVSYDLSRRVIIKELPIFSYGEYIFMKYNQKLAFSFIDLITDYKKLSFQINKYYSKDIDKETYLKYWEFGYFYQWYKEEFNFLLWNSFKKSIYEDIPQIAKLDTKNLKKLEKLIFYIVNMWASPITINALSTKVGLDNKIVSKYLDLLEQLWWIYKIQKYWSLSDTARKEEKIYISSNNLMYYFVLKEDSNLVWKIRETFFLQNIIRILWEKDWIRFKTRTDFVVYYSWKEYEFEVWWKSKKRIDDVFVVKDDVLLWEKNIIPLWLFGFLV